MRALQEQVKEAFCNFSVFSLEFQKFFLITRTFFLTVGQKYFSNKIPFFWENILKDSDDKNDILLTN